MTYGLLLLLLGGFLLGGTWSVFQLGQDEGEPRSTTQIVMAVVLLVAALLASAAGVLYLIG
ncbi:hypothetical protein [Blastococcus sp. CCUG 61487]|uniref:hypothetical protein n=1 Tax=Blastococcus sp. CCUG 61487 TaxID=1840703 RepID=UPI0010C138F2|nr:hypothetical protein [Blastococcus sp. CCUG 61487]TKJ18194.1 hypothetical protein A6V29_11980 [Blastococcus sp. CCUG 61487]